MPTIADTPFSFTLPSERPFAMTAGAQAIASLHYPSPFFEDILAHILKSPEMTFLTRQDRILMQFCLTILWPNTPETIEPKLIGAQYKHFFDNEEQRITLLNILMAARNQVQIEGRKRNGVMTEQEHLEFLKTTQKRLVFMMTIISAIGDPFFASQSSEIYDPVLMAMFEDIKIILSNISSGLYKNYFTSEHKTLTLYFQQGIGMSETLRRAISDKKRPFMDEFLSSFITLHCIPHPLYMAMFCSAIGHDDLACKQFDKQYTLYKALATANTGDALLDEASSWTLKTLSLLEKEIRNDHSRKAYTLLHSTMDTWFLVKLQVVQNSAHPELLAQLKTFNRHLKKISELTLDSLETIHPNLLLLHLTYLDDYRHNTEVLTLCQTIILKLQKIILKNKGNIIAVQINDYLKIYLNRMTEMVAKIKTSGPNRTTSAPLKQTSASYEKKSEPLPLPLKKVASPPITLAQQLKTLQLAIEECDTEIATLSAQNSALESEISYQAKEGEKTTQQTQALTEEIIRLEAIQTLKTQEMEENKAQIQLLQSNIKDLQKKQALKTKKQAKINQKIIALTKDNGVLHQKNNHSLGTAPESITSLSEAIKDKTADIAKEQQKKEAITVFLKNMKATQKILQDEITVIQTEQDTQCASLKAEIMQIEKVSQELHLQNESLYTEIKHLHGTLSQIYQDQQIIDATNRKIYGNRLETVKGLYVQPLKGLLSSRPMPALLPTPPNVVFAYPRLPILSSPGLPMKMGPVMTKFAPTSTKS